MVIRCQHYFPIFFFKDELDGVDLIPHSVAGVYALLFCLLKRLPYRLFFRSPDILDYTGMYSGGLNYRNEGY